MNILFSITNLSDGGAQTFVIRLANHLSAQHKVFLFSLEDYRQSKLRGMIGTSVIPIFPWTRHKIISKLLRVIRRLSNLVGHSLNLETQVLSAQLSFILLFHRINTISSHLFHSDKLVCSLPLLGKASLCVTDHGDYSYVLEKNIASISDIKKIFSKALMIGVSQANLNSIGKLSRELGIIPQCLKIFNGFDPPNDLDSSTNYLRFNLGLDPSAFIFGMVARGIKEKGWAEALSAHQFILSQGFLNSHLVFIGDSDYLQDLKHLLPASSLANIHFAGFSDNPMKWIAGFDVGLLPTYFKGESLPCSIIEYFSARKPVISTDVGGIREMCTINDHIPGYLLTLNELGLPSVDSIASAMRSYLVEPDLLSRHSALAGLAFKKFEMRKCANSYIKAFKQHHKPIHR
jgi:glycosyltransferase involved in cell wall biosynthesis